MQLASLDNSTAVDAQAALVKPNFVAASQSSSLAKNASQGASAAEKGGKAARASYSASKKAATFAAKIESARVPKPNSLKSKSASN